MRSSYRFYLAMAFILVCAREAYAQMSWEPPVPAQPYESDILYARPVRYYLGIGFGGSFYQHLGSFIPIPESCECEFKDRTGVRFHIAPEFSIYYPKLGFALKFLFHYYNFSEKFSYNVTRKTQVVGANEAIDVEYNKSSNVEMQYISFAPGFAWYFGTSDVFVLGGLEAAVPIKAKYDNVEKINGNPPPVTFYDGSTERVFLVSDEIPESNRVRFGIHAGVGMDFKLGSRFLITPQVGGTLPLNPVSSEHSSWKVAREYALLFVKVRL